ncbi:hypothetical protein PoB_000679500 [Plakobranchus ocellatus]|uniref:Uncharacterized protein n=1 Tax=Plakobranchus ocellatus TaxID=259542 RepID=A0AAV3YCN1_9GAST|nr:hypothetical protein PoB_000679500 [Plakobranchus ocellatus]
MGVVRSGTEQDITYNSLCAVYYRGVGVGRSGTELDPTYKSLCADHYRVWVVEEDQEQSLTPYTNHCVPTITGCGWYREIRNRAGPHIQIIVCRPLQGMGVGRSGTELNPTYNSLCAVYHRVWVEGDQEQSWTPHTNHCVPSITGYGCREVRNRAGPHIQIIVCRL